MAPLTEEQIAAKEAELKEREDALAAAGGDDLDNGAWKKHPLTTKLTSQVAEYQRAEEERKAAAEKARQDAEIADAEKKADWEKAAKLKDEQHKAELDALKVTTTKAKLKGELAAKGFDPDSLDFLVYKYDAGKHPEIDDYVKAAFEDEGNKKFLATQPARVPKDPPGTPPSGGEVDWEQVKAWETCTDDTPEARENRAKARKANRAYRDAHNGEFPYKL